MIAIREFADIDDPQVTSTWERLTDGGWCPSLFMSYPWVRGWFGVHAASRRARILVGYSDGRAVGLAPLFRAPDGAVEFPVSPNPLSLRGEFLAESDRADEFGVAVVEHLRHAGGHLRLKGVPRGSATARAFCPAPGFIRHERVSRRAPFIAIDGSWEEYLASRPRKVTHEWERKIRRIRRRGAVEVRRGANGDVGRLVEEFVEIEGRSWKEERGSSIGRRGMGPFYAAVAEVLADRGWFLPFWLTFEGKMIAFVYGFVMNETYWAIKTSYDKDYAGLSPGVPLFYEAVGHAFRSGLSRFDFVGHASRWTDEWATGWLEHVDVRLYPRSMLGLGRYLVDRWMQPALGRVSRIG